MAQAHGRARTRLDHLAASERAFQGLAQRVNDAHSGFIDRVTRRFEKADKPQQKAYGGPVIATGLDVARHYAMGGEADADYFAHQEARGMMHTGSLMSVVPGRTDRLSISVPGGSYVMPADIVSALGEGNTLAGSRILDKMFAQGPYGAAMPRLNSPGVRMPWRTAEPYHAATGGSFPSQKPVPIVAAGGEYVVHPDAIASKFGDLKAGHKVLDQFVHHVRKKTVKTLSKLPGPKK